MSDLEERFCSKCPRKLTKLPKDACHLAVMKLKQLRSLGHESTDAEETSLHGCNWAVDHQMSCYCFFAYEAKYLQESGASDAEIAALLNISTDTVKEVANAAINVTRGAKFVKELKENMGGENIVDVRLDIDDETIYCE
jgi:hypothetical protein